MKDIFKKEIYRVFSDKKMIFSLFILPAVLMFALYGLMGFLIKNMVNDVEKHVSTVYIQNAPEGFEDIAKTTDYGKNETITYLSANEPSEKMEEIRKSILEGDADLLVIFDEKFEEKVTSYKEAGDPIPTVTIGFNSAENYSSAARGNFQNSILSVMQTSLLQQRFGNLDLLNVFNTTEEEIVSEEKKNGAFFAQMMPYLITFLLFASSMGLCTDAIAGEKERGTMASMLLSPVSRTQIVYGKLLGLSVLSCLSSVVYAFSTIFAMPLMGSGLADAETEGLPISVSLSPVQAIELLAMMITLVFVYVAVLCLVSVFAKNMKEANAYVMPIYMIVLVAGIMTMFQGSADPASYMYGIPVYGTALSIQRLMTNELTMTQFGFSIISNLVLMAIFVVGIARSFNNEKIMLNA